MCFYLLPRINHSTQQIHSFISETYTSDEKEFSDIIVNKTLHNPKYSFTSSSMHFLSQ